MAEDNAPNVQQAYDQWSVQYDTNHNRTRDLEALALREMLAEVHVESCLEIGCGTGKNAQWLVGRTRQLTAVDLSGQMLAKARQKVSSDNVQFVQADITMDWSFVHHPYDLVTFSLVLEHLEDLGNIFRKASAALQPGGLAYVGELHPFKQYQGTKARFETAAGVHTVSCFTHHLSDFTSAAYQHQLAPVRLEEYFDDPQKNGLPRILALLFRKTTTV